MEKEFAVSDVRQRDIGRGIARIDASCLKELDLQPGYPLGLVGKKKTIVVACPAYSKDQGKGIVRIDENTRKNAGVAIGENVRVFFR